MRTSSVKAEAPCRIDLAGGTLDIHPLYLLMPESCTVNLAINLKVEVEAASTGGDKIELESIDQGRKAAFIPSEDMSVPQSLELPAQIAGYFFPQGGVLIRTRSHSPVGAGLAASSALCVAAIAALKTLKGEEQLELDAFVRLCIDLEARVMGTPAGCQDFYPAINGGLQEIKFSLGELDSSPLDVDLNEISKRAMLVYTGRPHHSGLNNWEVFKAFIDGEGEVRSALSEIGYTAVQMAGALKSADWNAVGRLLGREWAQRQRLSPLVTTPTINALIEEAEAAGGSGKVCGAGGGGCVVIWYDGSANTRRALEDAARRLGATPVPWQPSKAGCLTFT